VPDAAPCAATAREAPTLLDIEASGFGRGSYPIEVGFVLAGGESDCMLIRPAPQWTHWDPAAERLHRISRATLRSHGRTPADVVAALNATLYGCTAYTDGWAQDYTWLAVLYDAVNRVPSFRIESLRALLSDDEALRWHRTKQEVADELALERHRASADARLLQATFRRVRAQSKAGEKAAASRDAARAPTVAQQRGGPAAPATPVSPSPLPAPSPSASARAGP
jgi:hypothetical protein